MGRRFVNKLVIFIYVLSVLTQIPVSSAFAFAGGDGSEGSPYQIATCADFMDIEDDLDAYYVLNNDIDCTSDGNAITVGVSDNFSGVFDGNEHSIVIAINDPESNNAALFASMLGAIVSDLTITGTINTDNSYAGALAGYVWESFLENITSTVTVSQYGEAETAGGVVGQFGGADAIATNVSSSGDVSGLGHYIGGLFGRSECGAEISDSFSTGDVTGADNVGGISGFDGCEGPGSTFTNVYSTGDIDGGDSVGGIVGYGWSGDITLAYSTGAITSDGSAGGIYGATNNNENFDIIKSYSTGSVVGGDSTGGIAGVFNGGGSISQSFSTADVTTTGENAGGIAGFVTGGSSIVDSYSRGPIEGNLNGGIAGIIEWGWTEKSYSTSLIDQSAESYGGVVASLGEAGADNTFWDTETSGTGISDGGTGKTTAEMKAIATFTTDLGEDSWDFDEVWALDAEVNDGYPCLQWNEENCVSENAEAGDDDNDGISSAVEDAAPNSGDANNDGTADSEQANVASYVNSVKGGYSTLAVDEECSIENIQSVSELADGAKEDVNYEYPAGLMDFSIDCGTPGFVATISQYYYGVDDDDFIVRKYNPTTKEYFTVADAVISFTTIDGNPVTLATYQVTDGGELDLDGEANGVIVDPAGLAQVAVGVPNTGLGQKSNLLTIVSSIIGLSLMLGYWWRYAHHSNSPSK